MRAEIVSAAKAAAPNSTIDDQMTLARGASDGFSDIAKFSVGELTGLASGTASILMLTFR